MLKPVDDLGSEDMSIFFVACYNRTITMIRMSDSSSLGENGFRISTVQAFFFFFFESAVFRCESM